MIGEVGKALEVAAKADDEATIDLRGGVLDELEYERWLLRAFLEEPSNGGGTRGSPAGVSFWR